MNRLDFNKELYLNEIDRKKSLNDALSIPIGVITGQLALLYFLYDNFEFVGKIFTLTWKSSFLILDIVLILVSVYFLTISFYRPVIRRNPRRLESQFDYQYIDLPSRYEQYFQDTLTQNNQTSVANPAQQADSELENVLIEDIVATTSHNINLNDIKTERIAKAKLFLVFSVFTSLLLVVLAFK